MTTEEVERLATKIAHEITKRRMEVPAILMLELHKPFANFNAHAALATSGFFAPLLGYERFNDLTRLLGKRDNVERLISTIEEQAAERDAKPSLTNDKA